MKTVIDNINEIIINKSKFIALTYKVDNIDSINKLLNESKLLYKGATHYCYAYILDNMEKCSDDGEPSGTAGLPILNILKKENINNVLCIVIRYFGGIKLGAGGLIRAYGNACKNCLIIKELNEGYLMKIEFEYPNINEINYLLKDIVNKDFSNKPIYTFKIKLNDYDLIKNRLNNLGKIEIIDKIYL